MGERQLGSYSTFEVRKGRKSPFYGKHHTEEAKRKISETLKGRKLTEETKQKIGKASKGRKSPMYGKHHTEETKQKLSEAKKGENNPLYGVYGQACPNTKGYVLVLMDGSLTEIVGLYENAEEVVRKLPSIDGKKLQSSSICRVISGKGKSHGGYWYERLTPEEAEPYMRYLK